MASLDETLPYTAIGEALRGLETRKLPDGVIPTEGIMLIKGIDEDGDPVWLMRYTQGVSQVETIGALTCLLSHEKERFESQWRPDVDDDD